MKLLPKISLILVGGIGTALLVAGILDFYYTRAAWERSISSQQIELGTKVTDEIDRFLYERYLDMLAIGEDDTFEKFLKGGDVADSVTEDRIHELADFSGPWETLFAVNLDGVIVASAIEDKIGKKIEEEANNYEAFKLSKAKRSGVYYSDIAPSDDTGKPVMTFGVPVRNEEASGQPAVGVIIGHLSLRTIQDILHNIDTATELNLYTQDGKLIATNKESPKNLFVVEPKTLPLIQETLKEGRAITNVSADIEYIHEEELRAVVPSSGYLGYKGNGWVLIAEAPIESVFAPAREQATRALFLFIIGFLIALGLVLLFFKRFVVSPIASLALFSKAVAAGDLSKRNEIISNDEIGELSLVFNEMTEKLQKSYTDLEKKITDRTKELNSTVAELGKNKIAILSLLQDINNEKKDVEKKVDERTRELKEEQARLLASINSLSLGFLIADIEHKVLFKNKAMMELFGLKDSDVLSIEKISELTGEHFNVKAEAEKCLKIAKVCEIKEILFDKKFLRGIIAPIIVVRPDLKTTETIGYVLLLEDITDAKVMERSREEFFAVASHELRTPLTAIRGSMSLLRDFFGADIKNPDAKELVDNSYTASIRLIGIVNDFLDASRLEQGKITLKKENIDLLALTQEVAGELKKIAGDKGLTILVKEEKGLPLVFADKDRTKQVIYNLFSNAVNYTKEGKIEVELKKTGGFLNLFVSDTGKGISAENQTLLFRKFQQAGESMLARDMTKSTGLGLYISKLIIESMGGKIWIEKSALGKGSTFAFSLPLANGDI